VVRENYPGDHSAFNLVLFVFDLVRGEHEELVAGKLTSKAISNVSARRTAQPPAMEGAD
jgi:hypothetical protein